MQRNNVSRLAVLALLAMAVLWGASFPITKGAITGVPPADLLAARYVLGFLVLAVALPNRLRHCRSVLVPGTILGVLYASGQLTQTVALTVIPASTSGFLTGTYVILTPLLASLLGHQRITLKVWAAVALALAGLGILSVVPAEVGAGAWWGNALTLLSALFFALHILATGRFATPRNALELTIVQTAAMALVCVIFAAPGGITLPSTNEGWIALIYLAVFSGALAMILQSWAQAHTDATRAAVIMCSEPVWAAVFAVGLGTETLTWQMLIGGLAVVGAMYLVAGPVPSGDRLRSIVGVRGSSDSHRHHPGRSRSRVRNHETGGAPPIHQGPRGERLDIH